MGKLLKFALPSKVEDVRERARGDAQIFIFTGVRYERGTPPPNGTSLDGKRRKRKRV